MLTKDNIKSYLSFQGVQPAAGKEYMADIFGQEGEDGPDNCQNRTEFDRDYQILRQYGKKDKQDMPKALNFTSTL